MQINDSPGGAASFSNSTTLGGYFTYIDPAITVAIHDPYILELKGNNQHGTAVGYEIAMHSLFKFKPDLQFEDLTKEFLEKFELWMLERGKSITTVSIYIRTLRAIMNLARSNGIKFPDYPFGRKKYLIPATRNIKKVLNIDQIKQLFNYPTVEYSGLDKAKDFWILSYLCNGINMSDIVRLRWCNLNPETIAFEREKQDAPNATLR